MNARNAPWIVALFTIASLCAGCAFGLVFGQRRASKRPRCEVPCASTLRIEATAPAVFTVSCGGAR